MHLWHDIIPGPDAPDVIHVIVEIPKGSRNKYELHKETGHVKLDRVLYSSLHYPGDYGLIPQTYYDDGDPLDVLVMTNSPSFPGCLLEARPIGLFRMTDKDLPDDKVLAVLENDPFFTDWRDIGDIPQHFLAEMAHFFFRCTRTWNGRARKPWAGNLRRRPGKRSGTPFVCTKRNMVRVKVCAGGDRSDRWTANPL